MDGFWLALSWTVRSGHTHITRTLRPSAEELSLPPTARANPQPRERAALQVILCHQVNLPTVQPPLTSWL